MKGVANFIAMNSAIKWHKIGSWAFILLGAGHILTALLASPTPEQSRMLNEMANYIIPMPGWSTTLLSLYNGFSFTMGLLLIACGMLNVLIVGLFSADNVRTKIRSIALFNIILSLVILAMSVKFFFIVPVVFSVVALIAYANFYRRMCALAKNTRV